VAIERLRVQGVRNLEPFEIELSSRLNLFVGDNGAGKSSVLEAVHLLLTGKSFRTRKLNTIVTSDQPAFYLFGELSDKKKLGLGFQKEIGKSEIQVNGQRKRRLADLAAIMPVQCISPDVNNLIDATPRFRRGFLDWYLFHVEHNYLEHWQQYNKALEQRNALLKQHNGVSQTIKAELAPWDQLLISKGMIINHLRSALVEQLNTDIQRWIGANIEDSFNQLDIGLGYKKGFKTDLEEELMESLAHDLRYKTTTLGPHRGDLMIRVGRQQAGEVLSRGQKKRLVNLIHYLSLVSLIDHSADESLQAAFLLDDFTSELDKDNQFNLLEHLLDCQNVQIFASSVDMETALMVRKVYNKAQMFHVKQGQVSPLRSIA